MLEKVVKGKGIQALVLTPTRELCVQVADNLVSYSQFLRFNVVSVYGGVGIVPQIDALRTADIVVGTPGRILDHLQRRTINLQNIRFMVLDEADRMFDMGFIEDVERILSQTPKSRQTMLFSATMPESILNLVRKHLKSPEVVKEKIFVDQSLLRQTFYDVPTYDKFSLLVHLLKNKTPGLAIVFCGTKREVDVITRNLKLQGLKVMAVHGGLSQNRRLEAVDSLKKSEIPILVATDVAARGLDIRGISHIYNYDVPKTAEDYTHRIGRTARAGERGSAITILAERDHDVFRRILWEGNLKLHKENLPGFERVRFNTEATRERRFGRGMPRREGAGFPRSGPRQGGRAGGPRFGGRAPRHDGESRPPRGDRPQRGGSRFGGRSREPRGEREQYRPPRFGSAG
jgi:ATP-dependent RNA helicase DeaD